MTRPSMSALAVKDTWFAWHPVPLSCLGDALGSPDPRGRFWVRSGKWAWLRKVYRYRGLYLAGAVYEELAHPARGR